MGNPWVNQNGVVAHPDSPAGGGGQGGARRPPPYDETDSARHPGPVPHPDSPAARGVVLDIKTSRKIAQAATPPSTRSDDPGLSRKVKQDTDDAVGKPPVGDGECYALADQALRKSSGASAPDFMSRITPNGDYVWGRLVTLDSVQPGDVLQFRDHKIKITTTTKVKTTRLDGSWDEHTQVGTESHSRGHHTAIVSVVNPDGTLLINEQHVIDPATQKRSTVVRQNTLYLKSTKAGPAKVVTQEGGATIETTTTTIVEVSGTVKPYRPQTAQAPLP